MARVYKASELNVALKAYQKSYLIAFPTDTVYGIGAHIFSELAIKKIYQIKQRSEKKPLAVLCADKAQILQVAKEIPFNMEKIIDAFMPGPLTVILPKKEEVPNYITSNLDTIGVRIPNHPLALAILKQIGPLATTSANISGDISLNNSEDVIKVLGKSIDIIIDGGITDIGVPSTVISIINDEIKIIREGTITKNMILEILKP